MDISKIKGLEGVYGAASKMAETMQTLQHPFRSVPNPEDLLSYKPDLNTSVLKPVDRRTRQEIREDRELELSKIDITDIEEAQSFMSGDDDIEDMDHEDIIRKRELVNDCLDKLHRYKKTFEQLNSDHSRRIALKEHELKVEAVEDWKEKWRTFWFRVLGSGLLIVTLFAIGTLNHNVSWLYLPFESVIKPGLSNTTIATQTLFEGSNNKPVAIHNQGETVNPSPITNNENVRPRSEIDTRTTGKE